MPIFCPQLSYAIYSVLKYFKTIASTKTEVFLDYVDVTSRSKYSQLQLLVYVAITLYFSVPKSNQSLSDS